MRLKLKYCHRVSRCQKCGRDIIKGEQTAAVQFRPKAQWASFHLPCFVSKVNDWYGKHPYVAETRRSICSPELRKERKRLQSRLYWHRRHNNIELAQELERQIHLLEQ